jgi:hypothetical protein
MAHNSWHFNLDGRHITITSDVAVYMDNASKAVTEFAHCYGFSVLEVTMGADRLQLRFEWQTQRFLLCFEALCDAMWIDCFYAENINQLADLYSYLLKRKDNNLRKSVP